MHWLQNHSIMSIAQVLVFGTQPRNKPVRQNLCLPNPRHIQLVVTELFASLTMKYYESLVYRMLILQMSPKLVLNESLLDLFEQNMQCRVELHLLAIKEEIFGNVKSRQVLLEDYDHHPSSVSYKLLLTLIKFCKPYKNI